MEEIWKDIRVNKGIDYEGKYKVSNLGNVKSLSKWGKGMLLSPQYNKYGYMYVVLYKNSKEMKHSIHRLVGQEFIQNPENKSDINHLNGIRDDNRLENLEWCTKGENQLHRNKILGFRQKSGEDNKRSKKIYQYDLDGNFIRIWYGLCNIQRQLGIGRSNITSCCLNKPRCKTAGGFIWKYK